MLSFGFQGYLLFVSNVHSDFDEPFLCVNSGFPALQFTQVIPPKLNSEFISEDLPGSKRCLS